MRRVRSAILRSRLGLRYVESHEEGRMPPGAAEQRPRGAGRATVRPPRARAPGRRAGGRLGALAPRPPRRARRSRACAAAAPVLVVEPFPPFARAGLGRGRQLELGERGAEVKAGAAHDERRRAGSEHLVDRVVRERRVLAHRRDVREGPDAHQPLRVGRAVREDRQAVVDLHRVGRDDLGRDQLRHGRRDVRLPARGRPEQADDEHGARPRRARAARRRVSSTSRSRWRPRRSRRERRRR